jgi:thymidylate kinase
VRWGRAAAGRSQRTAGPPPLRAPGELRAARAGRRPADRAAAQAAAVARTANRVAEEAYQEAVSRWHRSCGRIVVYDRFYPADYHAHDLSGHPDLPWDRRLHGAFLRRCFAPPDLLLVLDAEPELLHARKGEGTLEELASRRAEYLDYAATVPSARIIRVDQPLDDVVAAVVAAITEAVAEASRGTGPTARPAPPVPSARVEVSA